MNEKSTLQTIAQQVLDMVWFLINEISPPSNVLARFNILGGSMKEEALKTHSDAMAAADEALYDAGFADGQAGAQASGITQEQYDAFGTEKFEEGKKVGFDEGVASVHIPETPVGEGQLGYSQEQYDAVVTEKDAAKAELASVKEQVELAKTELATAKESEAKALSDDATDKEKIEALTAKLEAKDAMVEKIDALIHGL